MKIMDTSVVYVVTHWSPWMSRRLDGHLVCPDILLRDIVVVSGEKEENYRPLDAPVNITTFSCGSLMTEGGWLVGNQRGCVTCCVRKTCGVILVIESV
jgi:hypothetical protein